jgi:hypothetical protein
MTVSLKQVSEKGEDFAVLNSDTKNSIRIWMFSKQDYGLKVQMPHDMGDGSLFFSKEPSDATLHIC